MRAAAILALLPAVAGAQDDQDREALYTALAMNRCAVTEDETAAVFGSQGFDPEFVRQELGRMVLDETAFLEAGYVLRVKAEYCPPAEPAPTPAQSFRQAIGDNGCSIKERQARALGIDTDLMRPVVLAWLESGAASVEWDTLTLKDCG